MNILDPLSNIENQLNDFMNFEMNKCVDLNKFKGFFERYDIKSGNPKVEAKILDDNVLINIDYPITLTKEEEYTLKQNRLERAPDCGSVSLLMDLNEFHKKLKVDFKYFDSDFYYKDGNQLILKFGSAIAYLKLTNSENLYVWIYEETPTKKYLGV